jgi:hypothetical protein
VRAGVRQRPAVFRALGNRDLPETVVIQGREFRRLDTFKHDSWAATGLYQAAGQLAICKFNRQQSIGGLPMHWLGRLLGSRERKFLQRLAGIEGIPADLGEVTVAGRVQPSVVAREFIPGEILSAATSLPADFFERLRHLLQAVHRQGVAYVDLHKPENVLVSDEGRPYLFDFQISYALPEGWAGQFPPLRWWLACLQRSDDYHLLKHELHSGGAEARERLEQARPWWIKLHRLVAVPFRTCRRNLLVKLGIRTGRGSATTEAQPEVAFRDVATSSLKRAGV